MSYGSESEVMKELKLRGSVIRLDDNGLACLNDIWSAGGFTKNQKPSDWHRLTSSLKYIDAGFKQATGKSRSWTKSEMKSVFYTKNGIGTFGNIFIALEYAKFLNPALALEVNEVFIRYKTGDATLADETLQRASEEANEWAGKRALGRSRRKQFTGVLKDHGVNGFGYGNVTNTSYKALFGKTAKQLKESRDLSKSANLRDNLDTDEIVAVMFSEMLSGQRIENESSRGNKECILATKKSSEIVRHAIDENTTTQQPRMLD